jgi:hypothetical protein
MICERNCGTTVAVMSSVSSVSSVATPSRKGRRGLGQRQCGLASRVRSGIGFAGLLVAVSSCSDDPVVEPDLDRAYFRCRIQPLLDTHCSMLACHGDEQRPFRVFARNRLRLDADPVALNLPLIPEELNANYESTASFTHGPPHESLLAGKPLDEAAGGYVHDGRELYGRSDVFASRDDDDYRRLIEWMEGEAEDPACSYAGERPGPEPSQDGDT